MTIRQATSRDIPALVAMGARFFEASVYSEITEYDPLSAADAVHRLIENPDGVVIVCESGDFIDGMAGGLVYPFFFNKWHSHAQEMFWWVDDEARGTVGPRLRVALEQWARGRGALSVQMTALSSLRVKTVGRMYKRAGYRPSDETFVKGL